MSPSLISTASAALLAIGAPLSAQSAQDAELPRNQSIPEEGAGNDIIVSGESTSERVRDMGRQITRPSRFGRPIARFDAPLCVKVSGMPDDIAILVKERIEENASQLRGVRIDNDPDCDPNAFVGILNNVTEAVEQLEDDEPWLFEGLLSFQMERIYAGSDAVRSWHVFDRRNLDGSSLPVRQRNGEGASELVNRKEVATRLIQERVNMAGAVVLMETGALRGKTLRQVADYATIRLLASVSDDVREVPGAPPTMLTLFNEGSGPEGMTDFDFAYLESLYELPPNSRDGAVIAAAVKRYEDRLDLEPSG